MDNKKKYEKFLPIGTVVLLQNATQKVMITGFCVLTKEDDGSSKKYDYCGCIYPIGIYRNDELLVFNHNQISKIYFLGYQNQEEINFKSKLIKDINNIKE